MISSVVQDLYPSSSVVLKPVDIMLSFYAWQINGELPFYDIICDFEDLEFSSDINDAIEWIDILSDVLDLVESISEVTKTLLPNMECFDKTIEYCYQNVYYELLFKNDAGQEFKLADIHTILESEE